MRRYYVLFLAALPAIAMSVWLFQVAQAPRSVVIQQIAVTVVAAVIVGVLVRLRRRSSEVCGTWLVLALTVGLFVPLLIASPEGPKRWLALGAARLYVAPIVLPLIVFLLGAHVRSRLVCFVSTIGAAIALVLQPDAAQLSAFSLAMILVLLLAPMPRLLGLAVSAFLICFAFVAWRIPDTLAPVRYVEGIFQLASEVSLFALIAAIISAALPVIALIWIARTAASKAVMAVAIYYACLFAMAPLQVTPVPLAGFGAGPILGYMLVAGAISRTIVMDSKGLTNR